jgi:hypothetical protein
MRKVYLCLLLILFSANIFCQAPQKLSYQAIVRNSTSELVSDQVVGMQISIIAGSTDGTAVYVETQTPTTNSNGMISVEIGNGTVVTGDFGNINWSSGIFFIKTETDIEGGTNYTITGIQQMLSVPYAFYALEAKNAETANAMAHQDKFLYQKYFYIAGEEIFELWICNNDGTGNAKIPISLPAGLKLSGNGAKLSLDGEKLIFAVADDVDDGGYEYIYSVSLDGTNLTQLLKTSASDHEECFDEILQTF